MSPTTILVLVLAVVGIVVTINIYNSLVSLKNQVHRAWSNIDVILKQRFDEIPQIIQVVEQYAGYEASVLKNLVEARTRYGSSRAVSDKIKVANELSVALGGVLALGEAYPELKANENFVNLQSRVSMLESTLADRREVYNEAVTNFNTRIEQVPDLFVARILNYQEQTLFQVSATETQSPSLRMNLPKFGA